ncbi:MAG: TonB family protein [Gammaproteobacteria bacterium]|nr:TonB family protein [Gammaproteobacteria bacterium]
MHLDSKQPKVAIYIVISLLLHLLFVVLVMAEWKKTAAPKPAPLVMQLSAFSPAQIAESIVSEPSPESVVEPTPPTPSKQASPIEPHVETVKPVKSKTPPKPKPAKTKPKPAKTTKPPLVAEAQPIADTPATTPVIESSPTPTVEKPADVKTVVLSETDYNQGVSAALDKCKIYPRAARRLGQEGMISVKFKLNAAGKLVGDVTLINSSDSDLLNEAAIEVVKCANFPPFLEGMTGLEREFVLPLEYTLRKD